MSSLHCFCYPLARQKWPLREVLISTGGAGFVGAYYRSGWVEAHYIFHLRALAMNVASMASLACRVNPFFQSIGSYTFLRKKPGSFTSFQKNMDLKIIHSFTKKSSLIWKIVHKFGKKVHRFLKSVQPIWKTSSNLKKKFEPQKIHQFGKSSSILKKNWFWKKVIDFEKNHLFSKAVHQFWEKSHKILKRFIKFGKLFHGFWKKFINLKKSRVSKTSVHGFKKKSSSIWRKKYDFWKRKKNRMYKK